MPHIPSSPLPRFRSDAWRGGFIIDSPVYTGSIAAGGGTVVAATGCIYRIAPGATRVQMREIPEGFGDVVAIAVEPRATGRPARYAVATMDAVHLFDGKGMGSVRFPEDHGEVLDVKWVPRVVEKSVVDCLHVFFAGFRLALVPDGSKFGTFVRSPWPSERLDAMATDGAGGLAYAEYDDDCDELEVCISVDLKDELWGHKYCPVPGSFFGVQMVIAGDAVALSFELGGVWLTRNIRQDPFVELEPLRGLPARDGGSGGGAIAFEGTSPDAALFAVVRETRARSTIVRVDAEGRHERIVEVTVEQDGEAERLSYPPMIPAIAWDATRRTLWCAAGRAGVMCLAAPGAPMTFGLEGASRAVS